MDLPSFVAVRRRDLPGARLAAIRAEHERIREAVAVKDEQSAWRAKEVVARFIYSMWAYHAATPFIRDIYREVRQQQSKSPA